MEDNEIYNNAVGVYLTGAVGSTIRNNYIHHNEIWGISLMPWGIEDMDQIYAKNNLITGNIVVWNPIDLAHCDSCTGNTWESNKFYTKDGEEIPDPIVATAKSREGFLHVDSAASNIAGDAALLWMGTTSCDTAGRASQWSYIFTSDVQQKDFECWYFDQLVVQFDSVTIPWMISENNLPIPDPWLDSDSVLSIAGEMGGKSFIEAFELVNIEMNLHHSAGTGEIIWNVHYFAKDATLSVSFSETE